MAKINLTPVRQGTNCTIFADLFPETSDGICLTAQPISFRQIEMYETDQSVAKPTGLLTMSLEEAKKFAKKILEL